MRGIRERLSGVRWRLRRSEILRGVLASALLLLGSVIASLLLEALFRPGPVLRTILFWGAGCASLFSLAFFAGRPLLKLVGILPSESDETLARMIGAALPVVRDRLLNGLQLEQERERGLYSPALIDAALEEMEREIRSEDFNRVVSFAASRRLSRVLSAGIALALLLLFIFPDPFAGSLERLWRHGESFAIPLPFRLVVEPGNLDVIKGSPVTISVRVEGEPQPAIALRMRRDGESVDELRELAARGDGSFRFEIEALRTSTTYSAERDGIVSPRYRLTAIHRPSLRRLALTLIPPSYSRLPVRRLDDQMGDCSGLRGTRVLVAIETGAPCASAALLFEGGTRIPFTLNGEKGQAGFTLRTPGRYRIVLRDSQGVENVDPIDYTISVLPDGPPTGTIVVPGTNLDVTEESRIPMVFRIADDFGFSGLLLTHRLAQSRYAPQETSYQQIRIPIPAETTTEALLPYTWDLRSLNLVPEDVVEYRIEVLDNDAVSGPKRGISETYLLRYPSLDEVLAEADRDQEQALAAMQEALARAEESKRKAEQLRQELAKEGEKGEWQERKRVEELLARQEEIRKGIEEAARVLEATAERLQKNQLLSPETMEKYQELQKIMNDLQSPELAEALKELQRAMEGMSLEQMRQAMQKFAFSEEQFRAGIERTLNLLKRIQIEQKLDALARRADELAEKQGEAARGTRSSAEDTSARTGAAARQRELARDAASLQKEMEQTQTAMREFPGEMPLDEMEEARKAMDSSAFAPRMEEIAEQIEKGEAAGATAGQTEVEKDLKRTAGRMRQVKGAMQRNQQKQLVAAMRRLVEEMLDLSKRQEELKNQTRDLEQQSGQFRTRAQEQMELLRDLTGVADRMGRMSNRSFSITPEMGRSVGGALGQMGEALRGLEQRNGGAAGMAQSGAMAGLNESALQALNALNAMMQSGGEGMGMSGFLQRLRHLAGRQEGINAETRGLTPEQAAALGRLAGEQGAVRKSLEQLAREATASGQMSRLLGDLQRGVEEMREVQTDLARGEVSEETLRKQDRILSRLIDSQRSTRERDYENRRRAESGTTVARPGPGPLDLSTREGRSRLRQDLLRALEEGYAREYQELIRKYFEVLEQ